MTEDDNLSAGYEPVEPRRMSPRGRILSWIGGLLGLALLIGFAVWLTHHAASGDASGGGGRGGCS